MDWVRMKTQHDSRRINGLMTWLKTRAEWGAWPCLFVGILLLGLGICWGCFFSPPDYQQGETVRIMYVHVPASWFSLLIYGLMVALSLMTFVLRTPLFEVLCRAARPIGFTFATISLLTGAIWGKPTWGAWWVWDARLTSMLLLWFIYLSGIYLSGAFRDEERGARIAAMYTIIGGINLPIIKWSVTWWQTLHQPASLLRGGGSAIHQDFLGPLFTMSLAYGLLFMGVWIFRAAILLRKKQLLFKSLRQGAVVRIEKV